MDTGNLSRMPKEFLGPTSKFLSQVLSPKQSSPQLKIIPLRNNIGAAASTYDYYDSGRFPGVSILTWIF